MRLSDAFLAAIEALAEHKLRSALTMLGIMFGVGAVIAHEGLQIAAQRRQSVQVEAQPSQQRGPVHHRCEPQSGGLGLTQYEMINGAGRCVGMLQCRQTPVPHRLKGPERALRSWRGAECRRAAGRWRDGSERWWP